jgi:hypothetical protein
VPVSLQDGVALQTRAAEEVTCQALDTHRTEYNRCNAI